jgi:hypothetical protein
LTLDFVLRRAERYHFLAAAVTAAVATAAAGGWVEAAVVATAVAKNFAP